MPASSIRRTCAKLIEHLRQFTRRNKSNVLIGSAALLIFAFAFVHPALGTPIALALTVVTLRRKA
ncbi:hypothetical protein [Streptomyces xanthophaeus]